MNHSLRHTITTTEAMTTLRDTLRETLSPGRTAELFSKFISDPALNAGLQKALGKKADARMKTRVADALTAELLGFNNPHEMFAFYKDQRLFTRETYRYEHRYGCDIIESYVENGVSLSVLDAIAFNDVDFEFDRIEDSFDWTASDSKSIPLEEVSDADVILTASDNLTGIAFDLRYLSRNSYEHKHKAPTRRSLSVKWLESMMELVDTAASGINFGMSAVDTFEYISDSDVTVFSIPQSAFTSVSTLLRYWLDNDEVRELGISLDAITEQLPVKGVIDMGNNVILHYDLNHPVVMFCQDGNFLYSSGLYVHKTDPRRQALISLLNEA